MTSPLGRHGADARSSRYRAIPEGARRGAAAEGLSLRLVEGFEVFGPAYIEWLHTLMRDQGVSYARMRLLGALHWSEDPVIMSDRGAKLGVTPRNITKFVDALEREGLLRRVPHPIDRRATLLETTDAGARTAREEWAEHQRRASAAKSALPDDDRRELLRLLALLNGELRQRGMAGAWRGGARTSVAFSRPPRHRWRCERRRATRAPPPRDGPGGPRVGSVRRRLAALPGGSCRTACRRPLWRAPPGGYGRRRRPWATGRPPDDAPILLRARAIAARECAAACRVADTSARLPAETRVVRG